LGRRLPCLNDQPVPRVRARAYLYHHSDRRGHLVLELAANPELDRLPSCRDSADTIAVASVKSLGAGYKLNGFYDEMLAASGRPRPSYRRLSAHLERLGPAALA